MKLKKIFNKYIAIVPALVTITLIAAKCEYDPGVKVFYDLNQLRLEAVEKESLELIDNYEKNITKFWSDRQALNELKKLVFAKVREIENKAEQELKEYSEPAKAKVEHEDSDEKDSSVLTAKKALAKFDRSATEIKIPSEFTKIGKNAFNNFYNLGKIEFHDNVTEIRQGAFDNTDLDSVTLPKNLKVLGGFANTYIKTLEIPQSVTKNFARLFWQY
nr:leucine-rich repeat domain-containing protein [Mycoplasmopsis bovis]